MKVMTEKQWQILIDKDWGSSAIWIPSRSGGWANTDYEWLHLPDWLLDRFHYWSSWYEQCTPERIWEELDWASWEAYELSLAIDLKRLLGEKAQVFIWRRRGDKTLQEITIVPYDPDSLPR